MSWECFWNFNTVIKVSRVGLPVQSVCVSHELGVLIQHQCEEFNSQLRDMCITPEQQNQNYAIYTIISERKSPNY